jgi:hypothetical protein
MAPPKRDKSGFEATGTTEAQARAKYYKLLGRLLFVQAPVITTLFLWLLKTVFVNSVAKVYNERVAILRQYDLGWIYATWYVLYLTRTYLTINCNIARAPARVGRPDQHVYKVYNDGDNNEPSYVFMETKGAVGKFNRAQRAAFHMDESIALVLTSVLLTGFVLPRVVFVLTVLYSLGRLSFTTGYTQSLEGRLSTMVHYVIPEHVLVALVGIIAVQSIAFGK